MKNQEGLSPQPPSNTSIGEIGDILSEVVDGIPVELAIGVSGHLRDISGEFTEMTLGCGVATSLVEALDSLDRATTKCDAATEASLRAKNALIDYMGAIGVGPELQTDSDQCFQVQPDPKPPLTPALTRSSGHSQPSAAGQSKNVPYDRIISEAAHLAGLNDAEASTLVGLCDTLAGRYRYAELRAVGRNLAEAYPDAVHFNDIGHSSDHPKSRPIGLTIIGDPDGKGDNAYLEGPGHASEQGPDTITVIEELAARHPNLLRRLGYSALLACDHIDPDGMEMQQWASDAELREFAHGAWRGSWRDQVSWAYPTDTYTRLIPEIEASLSVIDTYRPDFVGSIHASQFASYIVASQCSPEMAAALSGILEASGLPINPDEPESTNDPVLAPGVFGTSTSDSYRKTRGRSSSGDVIENVNDGGTNIANHLPSTTTLMIPEVSMHVAVGSPGNPVTDKTHYGMVDYRTKQSLRIIDGIGEGLEGLGKWPEGQLHNPETRKLYRAAEWWQDTVPHILRSQVEAARKDDRGPGLLRQSEFGMRIGLPIVNSLIYAGNVRRLAVTAGNQTVVRRMTDVIDKGLAAIGPTRRVDPRVRVATQVLAILATMRHRG